MWFNELLLVISKYYESEKVCTDTNSYLLQIFSSPKGGAVGELLEKLRKGEEMDCIRSIIVYDLSSEVPRA